MTNPDTCDDILMVFHGSSGDATSALYRRLEACGPAGGLAVNLFRACKTSSRAKQYRRRRHKDESYGRKAWSIGNAAQILLDHAEAFGLTWGWGGDVKQDLSPPRFLRRSADRPGLVPYGGARRRP